MKGVPRTARTMIPIIVSEELLSRDGDPEEDDEADGDEDAARGGRRGDGEAIADEELVLLEAFVAEDVAVVLAALDGLAETVSRSVKRLLFSGRNMAAQWFHCHNNNFRLHKA